MPHIDSAAPAFEIPSNLKKTIAPRKGMLLLNMQLQASALLFSICVTIYCIIISIVIIYGAYDLTYMTLTECIKVIFCISFFHFSIFFFMRLYNFRKNNIYGSCIWYGYTKEAVYSATHNGQYISRWEVFTKWKEKKECFLLYSNGIWQILFKSCWTEDELEELRAIMREKIGRQQPRMRAS